MIAVKLDTVAVGVQGDDFPLTPSSMTIYLPNTAGLHRLQELMSEALLTLGKEGQLLKEQGKAPKS